jgi:hypothetical protein
VNASETLKRAPGFPEARSVFRFRSDSHWPSADYFLQQEPQSPLQHSWHLSLQQSAQVFPAAKDVAMAMARAANERIMVFIVFLR